MSNIRFSSLPAVVAPNSADAIPSTQADGIDRRYTPTQILIAAGATATPTASVPAEWDANKNLSASNFIPGYATYVTSVLTPVTLTVASAYQQFFTNGTPGQVVNLPVTSTLPNPASGTAWNVLINNNSGAAITVKSSGGNIVALVGTLTIGVFTCIGQGHTTAVDWDYYVVPIADSTTIVNNNGIFTAVLSAMFGIVGGANTDVLYNNNGFIGQYTVSGSNSVAMTTSPTFTTPTLGAATATSLNGNTFTTGTYTLTGTAGKTLNFTNTLTISGTDSTTMTFPATSTTVAGLGIAQTFSAANIFSVNGAASTPAVFLTGTIDASATVAQLLIQPTGTSAFSGSASGQAIGVNLASGSTAQFANFELNALQCGNISQGQTTYQAHVGGLISLYRTDAQAQTTTYGWNELTCGSNVAYYFTASGGFQFGSAIQLANVASGTTVVSVTGNSYCSIALDKAGTSGGGFNVASQTRWVGIFTASPGGQLEVDANASTTVCCIFKAAASRTAAIAQGQTSAGGSLGQWGSGCVFDKFTDTSTTHTDGATYDTLATYTTVANALIVAGDKIWFDFTCTTVAHATATREWKVLFAGITIFDSTAFATVVAATVRIHGYIMMASSTTCRAHISFRPAGSAADLSNQKEAYVPASTLTGLTLTNTNILALQAVAGGTGAASGDITCSLGTIRYESFGG